MSLALSRALDPLRFRPLLWMALAALLGVAAGGQWAQRIEPASRQDFALLWPFLLVPGIAWGAWRFRTNGLIRRLAIAVSLFFAFTTFAARRVTPPERDIAQLTVLKNVPLGTIQTLPLKLSGVVADYPRLSDFNIQFPFECSAPRQGRVWITAPYGQQFEIGDRLDLLAELRPLPHPGNLGERESSWRFIGADCWCLGRHVVVAQRLGVAPGFGLARAIGRWRAGLLHFYEAQFRGYGNDESLRMRPFPAATAQLLTAMVFGEGGLSRPLPGVLRDDFRGAGLSHVLVSSGTQVAFLALLIMGAAKFAGVRRAPLLLVLVPILVLYGMMAGGASSIWRATLGGVLLCCAGLLGRDFDGLSVWGAALLLLLFLDPAVAWSLSFQLTFAATWGMLVVAPALVKTFESQFERNSWVTGTCFSIGAQSATLPLSLLHFGTFSASGLGANFFAIPLAGAMVGTGMLGLFIHPVNLLNYYLTRGVASLAHLFAALPGAYYEGSLVSLTAVWLIYALVLIAIVPLAIDTADVRETWRRKWKAWQGKLPEPKPIPIAAALFLLGLWLCYLQFWPGNARLRVTMIDVGQGESILVRCPSGQNILIDGGSLETQPRSDIGAQVLVPTLQSLGVDKIDLLVLTHSDADHCNGLATVVREIPIDAFLDGPSATHHTLDPAVADYFQLRKALEAKKVPLIVPAKGQSFQFGAVKMKLLAPDMPAFPSENNNCIVSKLEFGQTSFLLTGDIEQIAEERLVQRGADLKCTVLKVPHHGSKGSSSEAFLNAAKPSLALISCGRYNSFGHPGAQTLRRLDERSATVFRTDVSGAIEVDCTEKACQVGTYR